MQLILNSKVHTSTEPDIILSYLLCDLLVIKALESYIEQLSLTKGYM